MEKRAVVLPNWLHRLLYCREATPSDHAEASVDNATRDLELTNADAKQKIGEAKHNLRGAVMKLQGAARQVTKQANAIDEFADEMLGRLRNGGNCADHK